MAPPPRPLIDDVTAEILLHLPPDEPEHLFRAALVCKPWLRIICDPGFRRRYREFHGAPPLLGLLHRLIVFQGDAPARFASTTSMPDFPHPGSDGRRTRPLDCRHGRVLIHMLHDCEGEYLVWDPVTGDRHYLPREPEEIDWLIYSAVVLCATDGCDHLDCHGGPFRVVFAATHERKDIILASVYSSETGAWSVPVCLDDTCETYAQHMREARSSANGPCARFYIPYLQPRRGALVGDAVYFTVRGGNAVVKYDLGKDRLSMIDSPQPDVYGIAITAMENNTSLGFACIQGSILYTWSRKVDTEKEAAEWVQYRVIDLEKTIPVANLNDDPFMNGFEEGVGAVVVGFAEGVGVVFVCSGVGLFTIHLNSGQVKKVDEPRKYFSVLPYMSFYLPEIGIGGEHDATGLLHNT